MTEKVTARCSWAQTAGKELQQVIPTRHSDEDVFEKPDLDDVIDEERAVLFSNNDCPSIPCELQFQISPNFKIAAITLVCSAPKVEVFVGPTQEYLETIYGTSLEEQEADIPIRPYRYDVEIDRSGIAEINLKLLTSAKEICVYGAMLHIAPNPNGITTQQQKPFDIQKIQELLQKGGASGCSNQADENDEKLQKFLCMMKGLSCPAQPNPMPPATDADVSPSVQQQIDAKFEQLQLTITKRLDEFEAQQTAKLDRIIAMLEKKK
ncbi:uncharacterized protein LOC6573118 [Drosophila mojavensis]|uniref:Uncharacterized protein n=1 Tax=Drosophila mojavensis TaxID=7230 RepID=B4KAZ2_DROMO|nr:uncharacterized protein LOC6573118 [Drosophila mojavensis]EDW14670.1 uncharacterized protein Dmoj_GI24381 [Drosophila mojavensis]